MRYKDYSLEKKDEVVIGHVDTGIDFDKVLRFRVSSHWMQYDEECMNCPVADSCSHCQAQSYDSADTPTNFQRSKYICLMHKARIRASNYYYNRLYHEKGIQEDPGTTGRSLYLILSDRYETFCECPASVQGERKMNADIVQQALAYSAYHFFAPVFVHDRECPDFSLMQGNTEYRIQHILSARFYKEAERCSDSILVFDKQLLDIPCRHQDSCIFNADWKEISHLSEDIIRLFEKTDRIHLNLLHMEEEDKIELYKEELQKISEYLYTSWTKSGNQKEFNKITDVLFCEKPEYCNAGEKLFAVSWDGGIYTCPAAYAKGDQPVGSIRSRNMPAALNQRLYTLDYAPLCRSCPATHCVRCAVANLQKTGEVNVPARHKCLVSMAEYEISRQFLEKLKKEAGTDYLPYRELAEFPYATPYEYFVRNEKIGYKMKRSK